MVLGEAHAISALSPSQLSLRQAFLEDDTSLSEELNDVGSRHGVSINATNLFGSRSAIGRLTARVTDCMQR